MKITCAILSSVACPALPYFPCISHKQHNFQRWGGGRLLSIKCVFDFICNFCWNILHSKKNSARFYHKCTCIFAWSTCYSCQILMKLEFSWHIFKKYSNIKFHENLSGGTRVVPCWWMDMMKVIVAFCNFATAPKREKEPYFHIHMSSLCFWDTALCHWVTGGTNYPVETMQ